MRLMRWVGRVRAKRVVMDAQPKAIDLELEPRLMAETLT